MKYKYKSVRIYIIHRVLSGPILCLDNTKPLKTTDVILNKVSFNYKITYLNSNENRFKYKIFLIKYFKKTIKYSLTDRQTASYYMNTHRNNKIKASEWIE